MNVIGMMSGTSFDAIDAACAEITLIDHRLRLRPLGMLSRPYSQAVATRLARALPPAATDLATLCRLDTEIGQAFAELALEADRGLCGGCAALIASHGQTVYHWVEAGQVEGTLQIGQPAWIAERTGKPVVADFRPRDVAAGGQGAPLVSAIDAMWLRGRPGRPAALNLGGIANLTLVPESGEPLAFDSGPANALIDAAVRLFSADREHFDRNGDWAARGRVDETWLSELLAEPYYLRPAPKTTGKELFNLAYLQRALARRPGIAPGDALATLTALSAESVASAARGLGVTELVVSGGGTRNPLLMTMLERALGGVRVTSADALGLPSAAKEAYAFALLGFLTWHGLPGTVASCTGARGPRVLGAITPGAQALTLPAPACPSRPLSLEIVG
ncbi:anhydro-N-acetylmuramic acid kinase [Halotalea alkalilenta]|uniref:Anhydro-N-acetylmuramic acid kinase n=1 Tax=Halotalea alkalilenta TaxID=376489 RepID=A0A172YHC5_9GAMM|nr:anhydro-N-acetylmuramic acid kinase [Halotalea alkalilenta]ANF58658.1 anhydro-N-acetylmuramic acid kinase [Halotalea alkalilenta]